MASRVLEYIIRALDRTRQGTDSASRNVKGMAGDISAFSGKAGLGLLGLTSIIALVWASFKTGWDIGKKYILPLVSPTAQLAQTWEKCAKAMEITRKRTAEAVTEYKEFLALQKQERDERMQDVDRTVRASVDRAVAKGGVTQLQVTNAEIIGIRENLRIAKEVEIQTAKQLALDEKLGKKNAEVYEYFKNNPIGTWATVVDKDTGMFKTQLLVDQVAQMKKMDEITGRVKEHQQKIDLGKKAAKEASDAVKDLSHELVSYMNLRNKIRDQEKLDELKKEKARVDPLAARASAAASEAWDEWKDPVLRKERQDAAAAENAQRAAFEEQKKEFVNTYGHKAYGNVKEFGIEDMTPQKYENLTDQEQSTMRVMLEEGKKAGADKTLSKIEENTAKIAEQLSGRITMK